MLTILLSPLASGGIPADVLCESKVLAYEFAQKLMPERASTAGGLDAVAAGLGFAAGVDPTTFNCSVTPPAPTPAPPAPAPKPVVPKGTCSAVMTGVNLVYGAKDSKWNSTTTSAACEALCKADPGCTYGTWHDGDQGRYKHACIVRYDNQYSPHRQDGHFSFLCNMTGTTPQIPDQRASDLPWAWVPQPHGALPPRHAGWRAGVAPLPTAEAEAASLYVDAVKGSDSAAGTLAAPLKTIQSAVAKATAAGGALIFLRAGTFELASTVKITHSDITIAPYQQEEVVVSGGVQLTPKWTKTASLATTLDPPAHDTYVTDVPAGLTFIELFDGANNSRLVPARNPNGNPELDMNNFKLSGKATSCKNYPACDAVITNQTCEGCVDNAKGYFSYYSMGVGGPANNFVPAVSYWAQPKPHGGGANTYDIPNGVTFGGSESGGGTALKAGGGGYVFMLQTHTWGSWIYEIADVDATGKNITFGAGGFQEARGGSGGCGTGAFYISHRQEMLDSPGEWYLDEKAGKLYTAVLPGGTPPATVVASNIEQLFSVSGASQAAAVKNVRISSLTLRHAAPTYMANYSVGSGGDYAVHRGGAISLLNTMNVTIDHNLFDGVGGNGVWLHAFNRYAMVTANEMRNMGENGIGMTGETVWVDGTAGDQPRFNTIEGNLIHHVGLYNKQACAVFHAVSCQNSVKENVFFHGPRALFNMNDAFGGDTRIVSNLFFKSMLETHDHGPYNSWDRLPFLTTVKNGSKTIDSAYIHLTSNMFFSGSPFAIDTDDGSDGLNATSNVIISTPLLKTDFAGHQKTFTKNVAIFGDCGGSEPGSGDKTNIFTGQKCIGTYHPLLNKDGSCIPCKTPGPTGDCPVIQNNDYFTGAAGSAPKPVCAAGFVESGSQTLAMPADGGIALAKAALGM